MPRPRPTSSRPRGLSLRWQLTLSYAVFVVVVGVVLVAVGLLLLRFVPEGHLYVYGGGIAPSRSDLMPEFVRYATAGLVFLAALGLGGGWLLAGRVLRRLRAVTDAADRARGGDLQHRIALPGRSDELSVLADTFDAMLDRVQASVQEHERFAANASHELRTPHAVIRTMLEVARADPARDVERLIDRVETMNERSIALTEALLSLAQADHGAGHVERVDLAALTAATVAETEESAARREVVIVQRLDPAVADGNHQLLGRLVGNLVQNAVVYNHRGGEVRVATWTEDAEVAEAVVEVTNTGPVVPDGVAATLAEPFVRAAGRTRRPDATHVGAGLGLTIVASVVRAHSGSLDLAPRAEGGLVVRVRLPSAGPGARS